ncbi:MAG: hypothetical protein WBX23_12070 [Candidatus Cybelea sp.]
MTARDLTREEIEAQLPWARHRQALPEGIRRAGDSPEWQAVDEGLDLIFRAKHAEDDAALISFFAVMGSELPTTLGSLANRLVLLIMATLNPNAADSLRAMGEAFREAGMVEEATEYLLEVWASTPYRRDLPMGHGILVENVWSDVADSFLESTRLSEARREVRTPEDGIRPKERAAPRASLSDELVVIDIAPAASHSVIEAQTREAARA